MSRLFAPTPPQGLAAVPRRSTAFSIVMPAYQAAATIGDALGSALAQTHAAHEVVVVDDGSTDDLGRVLETFGDRIVVVRKENGGGASALNAGMAVATGEFVAILDADDAYHPRRLEVLARAAIDRPDLDLITTDAQFMVDGLAVGRFAEANPFAVTDQRKAILRSCFVGGWPAVRLARLRAVGGYDESFRIAYDWDCAFRLIFDGCRAGLVDEPYYSYSLHAGSLSAGRAASMWERVRLLEKGRNSGRLTDDEQSELMRLLRSYRTRAVLTETDEALSSRSGRLALVRHATSRNLGRRARAAVVLAAAAPPLARRLVPRDTAAAKRFTSAAQ